MFLNSLFTFPWKMTLLPFAFLTLASFIVIVHAAVPYTKEKIKSCDVLMYKDTRFKAKTGSGEKFDFTIPPRADEKWNSCAERCLQFGQGCKAINFKKGQCEFLRHGIDDPEKPNQKVGEDSTWVHGFIRCGDPKTEDKARSLDETIKQQLNKLIENNKKTFGIACGFNTFALRLFQNKYPWLKWWVALSKKEVKISSVGGHIIQTPATIASKPYYVIVAYTEPDTVIPPSQKVSWNMESPPQFWEKKGSTYIEEAGDFYDNVVLVKSKPTEYECAFSTPEFAFYKDKTSGKRVSGSGVKEGDFFFYYKAISMPNTFSCRAGTGDFAKVKAKRSQHCSGMSFAYVVSNILAHHSAGKKLVHANERTQLTSTLFKYFTSAYTDLLWTVYVGEPAHVTLLDCEGSTNCARVHVGDDGMQDVPVVAVWTPKCNLGAHKDNANLFFHWTQKIQEKVFSNVDNAIDTLSEYFQNPLEYLRKHNVNEKPEEEAALQDFAESSKVIFLNEVGQNASWNMNVQTQQQNGAQCQLVLKTKDHKKHYVFVRVDFYANFEKAGECKAPNGSRMKQPATNGSKMKQPETPNGSKMKQPATANGSKMKQPAKK